MILAVLAMAFTGCNKDNENDKKNSTTGTHNGHAWVDLGLPSGILWATCNIGADTPEAYGDYFAWGETTAKEDYSWLTYDYAFGSSRLTKYCTKSDFGSNGFTDGLTTLLPEDDAAHVNWGGEWRMPTIYEMHELVNNCNHTYDTQNGVEGHLFTAENGNKLFFPAAGKREDCVLYYEGMDGNFWSSTISIDSPTYARYFGFSSEFSDMIEYDGWRCLGFSVRPVCPAQH